MVHIVHFSLGTTISVCVLSEDLFLAYMNFIRPNWDIPNA